MGEYVFVQYEEGVGETFEAYTDEQMTKERASAMASALLVFSRMSIADSPRFAAQSDNDWFRIGIETAQAVAEELAMEVGRCL